ncbi:SDR family oxidoreductase [Brevibacterium album]|uniref:SDR family oxidoreductase n=1 Tax=Brevibacterium album TaxID=417948 RepID=UPI0004127859|nr:SDR family oxidoreductase [Brevibacterium album]
MTEEHAAGRTAVVTAGAAGIGRAIADRLQAAGYTVIVTDVSEAALAGARAAGFAAHRVDAGDHASVAAFAEELAASHEAVDLLVNNAGVAGPTARVEDIDPEEWEAVTRTNLSSQFFHVRALLPLLRRAQGAAIVNLSSAAGRLGMFGRSVYTASKAGVIGFTKTLAIELGPEGITANAICPGAVGGERIERVIADKAAVLGRPVADVEADYRGQSALAQFIEPESVAAVVEFLGGPGGRQMNGQVISVDGYTQKLY